MIETKREPAGGFAIVETVLILIIIGIIGGVGYWVVTQRNKTTTSTASSSLAPATGQVTAQAGTLSAIDQLTALDGQDEATINTKYDSVDQANALSSNTAASNIGGAYNEANF